MQRATQILAVFTADRTQLSLTQIATAVRLPKSTVHRLLATLRDAALIAQDPVTGSYQLGVGVLALAAAAQPLAAFRRRALPTLAQLRDQLGETVVFSVPAGRERVHVAVVRGSRPSQGKVVRGERVPLYAGAASKVLLASLSDSEIADYTRHTPLVPYSPSTTTSPDRLMHELAEIRRNGYAEGFNERNFGGVGVAAPVRDTVGETLGVVHLVLPRVRYTPTVREQSVELVTSAAACLSRALN